VARTAAHELAFLLTGVLILGAIKCAAQADRASRPQQTRNAGTVLRIYLARHGQTDWNLQQRLQGSTDIQLNAVGRDQATALARFMSDIPLAAVYCSPLKRSRETAEIVRGERPLTSLAELAERRFGGLEGQSTADPVARRAIDARRWDPADSLDGGETLAAFEARVRKAIDVIRTAHPTGNVLVVGHGGTNQMMLRVLLGLSLDQTAKIVQANDELFLLELEPGKAPRVWKRFTPE
jgi:broad specificity phosphatase PhoE